MRLEEKVNVYQFNPTEFSKRSELIKEFEEFGWTINRQIEFPELSQFLEDRMRKHLRREEFSLGNEEKKELENLFINVKKNKTDTYRSPTVSEIIDGVLEFQTSNDAKISTFNSELNDVSNEIKELLLEKETIDSHRESFRKLVKIEIIEASEVPKPEAQSKYFVVVNFESQKSKTRSVFGPTPIWNELFSYVVSDPNQKINVALWSEFPGKSDQFIGITILKLPNESSINAQQINEFWQSLTNEDGQEIPTRLRVTLQYLFDPVKFIDTKISDVEQKHSKIKENIARVNENTKKTIGCFNVIIARRLQTPQGSSTRAGNSTGSYDAKLSTLENLLGSQLKDYIPAQATNEKAPFYAILVYCALGSIILFGHSDFVNVFFYGMIDNKITMGLVLLYEYVFDSNVSKSKLRFLNYALAISVLYDFIQIFILKSVFFLVLNSEKDIA